MVNNNKIEDIFDEVDKTSNQKNKLTEKSSTIKTTDPLMKAPNISSLPEQKKSNFPFVMLIIFIVLVLVGIVYLVISGTFTDNSNASNENQTNSVVINENTNSAITNNFTNQSDMINIDNINQGPLDTDGDGLTDDEEIELGTSINKIDSDSDGLFDREEVKVYKTNPLENDSDSDGIQDGEEVENGYNPNGPGLLLDLTNSIDNLQ